MLAHATLQLAADLDVDVVDVPGTLSREDVPEGDGDGSEGRTPGATDSLRRGSASFRQRRRPPDPCDEHLVRPSLSSDGLEL